MRFLLWSRGQWLLVRGSLVPEDVHLEARGGRCRQRNLYCCVGHRRKGWDGVGHGEQLGRIALDLDGW